MLLGLDMFYEKKLPHPISYEAWTLLGLGVSVSDTDTSPTHIITLNYAIFSNY